MASRLHGAKRFCDSSGLLAPTAAPTLTLVTCYPFFLVGPAPQRFVVRARLVSASAG
jgi:sortase (surface protein transpeptidase)